MVARASNGMFGNRDSQPARRHSRELHPDVVRYIEEELALGRSYRAIEHSTGINREAIGKIAAGEHVSQLLGQRYQRCSRGHLTILPCRTCACLDERANRKKELAA